MYLHVELRSEYVFVLALQLCSHTYSYFARLRTPKPQKMARLHSINKCTKVKVVGGWRDSVPVKIA